MCDTVSRVSASRHFTVTTFVSTAEATLLHWHRKVKMWLPPGGHIEPNEDPIQAACREALEETGIVVQILPTSSAFGYPDPPQLAPPATIMIEPIGDFGDEQAHQHIDLIYFSRPQTQTQPEPSKPGWRWVTREQLQSEAPLTVDGRSAPISEDVRVLGVAAIDHVAQVEESTP